ncbi:hypothetical protein BDW74DRAFT_183273 [Aspergillus multicolor]|uniref:uncharacterized protein n=1 Tax=Aspergillus multicolor TaxID=41759 RepID=UPI003CCD47B3
MRSVSLGSDKAILQFAYDDASTAITQHNPPPPPPPPPLPPPGQQGVSPISAGFFGKRNSGVRVRMQDINPDVWVLLVEIARQHCNRSRSSSSSDNNDEGDNNAPLSYSFVKRPRINLVPGCTAEQQHEPPNSVLDLIDVDVAGNLAAFLRTTVPGIDTSTYERRLEDIEKDLQLCVPRALSETGTGRVERRIRVMLERRARELLERVLVL